MGEFDESVHAGRVLDHRAVAQRPVVAAACSRAGGAHQRAPQDHGDEVNQHAPGKAAQGGRGKALSGDGNGGSRHKARLRMEPISVEQAAGAHEYSRRPSTAFFAYSASRRTTWLTMIRSSAGGMTRTVTGEFSAEMTASPRRLLRAGSSTMPRAPRPAQISARQAMSFSPMPPVKTSMSRPFSSAT